MAINTGRWARWVQRARNQQHCETQANTTAIDRQGCELDNQQQGSGLDNQQHGKKQTGQWARQPTWQERDWAMGWTTNTARNTGRWARWVQRARNQQHCEIQTNNLTRESEVCFPTPPPPTFQCLDTSSHCYWQYTISPIVCARSLYQ